MTRRARVRRRRVAVVTGSRADYGLLQSTFKAVADHPRLELQLVATGMHWLPKFGSTWRTILSDGWKIAARVPMQRGDDGAADQAAGLARGVNSMARYFVEARTDVVLVLGDRIEAMAGALAGVTTGNVVAHIHGGVVAPGDFDGPLRDAITKLAHLHFPATRAAARRIVAMGESPDRVHWVGAPGLDRLYELIHERRHFRSVSRSTARAVLAARNHRPVSADESCERPFALIVQHPCGRSARQEFDAMTAILNAVDGIGLRRVVIYPNSDRGHSGILDAIKCHKLSQSAETHVVRSLARDDYLRLLLDARVLMGNSSSGIIEAPAAGTPVVNVGGRQAGRLRGGPCVVDAEENERSIRSALRKALAMHPRRGGRTPYGDGQAGRRIAEHVAEVPLDDRLRRKHPLPTRIMPPRKARDRSRRAGIDPRHLISRPTPATRRPSGLERNVRLRAWTCFSALLG